jgi:hypothetical protein
MNPRSNQFQVKFSPIDNLSDNIFHGITSPEPAMKSIIVRVDSNPISLVVPYSEALLSVLINARVVKLDAGFYPQTGTKFKLQDNQVRVEIVNDNALDNSDAIEKTEKKKKAEYLAKLKAEIASLESETE